MSELPEGWVVTDVESITRKASKNNLKNDPDKEIWYIDISSIDSGAQAIESPQRLNLSEAPSRARQIVESGDVLFSLVRPYLRKIAQVTPEFDGEVASTGFAVLRAIQGVDARFLFYKAISQDFVGALTKDQYGVSYPAVKEEQVKSQPLHLPPLNEQVRIVEKIEKLFAELGKGEESLETAKARAGLYRQSLLKHAFEGHLTADWRAANPSKLEDPEALLTRIQNERDARHKQALDDWQLELEKWRDEGEERRKPAKPKRPAEISADDHDPELLPELPEEWLLQHLGNLNVVVFDGPFGSNLKTSDYTDSGVQVIRLENIGYGNFITSKESFVSPEKYETIKKHTVFPGDIVFSSFVTEGVRSALVPSSVPFAVNKADCFAVQFFGATVSNDYVAHFLQSRWAYKAIEGLIHGVGRPRINTTQLKEIQVPVCSPAEQDEIVKQLDAKLSIIDATEKQLDEQLARSKALRQSILKRAFDGELVDQDPSDEPASELLERIKAEKAEAEIAAKRERKAKPVRKPTNRRPMMTDLIEVLKKEGDWVSASKAAQGLGIADGTSSDDVEAFYRQLKERIEANEIEVERRDDEDWLRLAKVEAT